MIKQLIYQHIKPTKKGNNRQIKKAVEAITESEKPLLYIGGGAILSNCAEEIKQFAKMTGIPAVETLMARGVMGSKNPLLFGMLGMHGEYAANMAMHETDCIISLGARFDDRVTGRLDEFARGAKVIHIDVDPASIGKIVNPHFPIVGNLKNVLESLIEAASSNDFGDYKSWVDTLDEYQKKEPLKFHNEKEGEALKPQWVIQRTGEILGDKAIISTDVGQHQMWSAQFYPFDFPRQWITSGGLGNYGIWFTSSYGC